jgi:transcriptional regulator with XRE-family HTH domain
MSKKFSELRKRMSPASRTQSDLLFGQMMVDMPLHELRKARDLSQVKLAEVLQVNQAAISKIEHRTDMYISTLREYIRAMGGDLQIVAKFPEGEVNITNFSDQVDRDAA